MRTITIAVALLGVFAFAGAGPPNEGISTSIVLARTRFLSTEKAHATLTIVNGTGSPIAFSHCDITVLTYTGSTWRAQPSCMDIYNINMLRPTTIDPSSRYTRDIELPRCEVNSDACFEDAQIRYVIHNGNDVLRYTTPLPRYEFVPDPTATFAVDGLSGNRPIFIVPGVAHDTVFPDTMVLEFAASSSEVHPPFTRVPVLVSQLATTLAAAGVAIAGTGFESDRDTWKAKVYVDHASTQRAGIGAALQTIREQFGKRISAITHYFEFNPSAYAQPVLEAAFTKAQQRAAELAETTGAEAVVNPLDWSHSSRYFYLGRLDVTWFLPELNQLRPFDERTPLNQTAFVPTPVSVIVENFYVGARTARPPETRETFKHAADAFAAPNSWFLPALSPKAIIAADRPELYVAGTASVREALARGLTPYFVADLDARARTRDLARVLDVRPDIASLFADYPSGEDAPLRSLGVATTFTGGDWRTWQSIKSDPGIRAYRLNDSRIRAMVPIEAPDASTTVTEMASATANLPPQALRLDAEFVQDTGPSSAQAATNHAIAALRRLPYVLDTASSSQLDNDRVRTRYDVVLADAQQSHLSSAFNVLRSFYDEFHPAITFRVNGLARNCGAAQDRLMKATVRENVLQAHDDAFQTHRNLRKVLLVAALPQNSATTCDFRSRVPENVDDFQSNPIPQVPSSVALAATSLMIFRTFPEQHH